MLKKILSFLNKVWLSFTVTSAQPVTDPSINDEYYYSSTAEEYLVHYVEKMKKTTSPKSLILEVEYSVDISNNDIARHLKQFYIVALNGTPRGYGDISFVRRILSMNGVVDCEYMGYGNFIIRKAVFAEWEVLIPQVKEMIISYIRQRVL